MAAIRSYRDLIVFQKSYKVSMEIFKLSQSYPKEERYFYPVKYFRIISDKIYKVFLKKINFTGQADQIRRSSRSVTANYLHVK